MWYAEELHQISGISTQIWMKEWYYIWKSACQWINQKCTFHSFSKRMRFGCKLKYHLILRIVCVKAYKFFCLIIFAFDRMYTLAIWCAYKRFTATNCIFWKRSRIRRRIWWIKVNKIFHRWASENGRVCGSLPYNDDR